MKQAKTEKKIFFRFLYHIMKISHMGYLGWQCGGPQEKHLRKFFFFFFL